MLGRKMSLVGGDHSLLAADFNDDMVKERSSETDWINKYVYYAKQNDVCLYVCPQGLWQEIDNLFIRTVLNQSLRGLI